VLLRFLDYAGAAAGIAGATIIALNLGINVWGYAVFMVSSSFYTIFGWRTGNWGLFSMNALFCIINLIGLLRHLS
jgi:hypothetical protein